MTARNSDRRYHYIVISPEQREALRSEAETRGTTMAALIQDALKHKALRLPNPGGSLIESIGIRSTEAELVRYENAASKRGLHRCEWERTRLFTPGSMTMAERRAMAREAATD